MSVWPYTALAWWKVGYVWNKLYLPASIDFKNLDISLLENRVKRVHDEKMFYHIQQIDNAIFFATVEYFKHIWAIWANLPLTTLMISSPWEVYAGQTLDYTTDALPVEIPNWFDAHRRIFLAESSQFYLELCLLSKWVDQVFSVYNSFRKERSDATHLSEFQHIEYEGKVWLTENVKIFTGLVEYICEYIFTNNSEDLLFFLDEETLLKKREMVKNWPITMNFRDVLDRLYYETKDEKYREFSLKHFGTWEEVKITELLGWNLIVEQFPMLQIPFYHDIAEEEIDGVPVAKNADYILYGYRETVWAWERIVSKDTLLKKADIFNLPKDDYMPYVVSRDFVDYERTSWFWLWRQRLTHWLLNQPYIYEATVFPRTHLLPNP